MLVFFVFNFLNGVLNGGFFLSFGGLGELTQQFPIQVILGLGQHVGEQAALGPAQHAGVTLLAGGRDRHRDIVEAVARGDRIGDIDA